jgi:ribosome-associated translation inhibitor RaiA
MQILVNSDHTITGDEGVTRRVESILEAAIDRFADRLTRVEVHLNDENGPKHGDHDKRCMMEARIGGIKPIAVTHKAPSLVEAIEGCADKLERALEHQLGKLNATAGGTAREEDIADLSQLEPQVLNGEQRGSHRR